MKTATTVTDHLREAARRATARADVAYQLGICGGLALMAGFIGTAGALLVHGAL